MARASSGPIASQGQHTLALFYKLDNLRKLSVLLRSICNVYNNIDDNDYGTLFFDFIVFFAERHKT